MSAPWAPAPPICSAVVPTALAYVIEADRVVIATDTLAMDGADHNPSHFVSKVYPLPHLDAALAATGDLQLATWAYDALQNRAIARDVLAVARDARDLLAELWEKRSKLDGVATATVYLFGYHPHEDRFVVWVYRSERAFEPEQQSEVVAMKPPVEKLPTADGRVDFVALLTMQKDQDDALPIGERVGIGGDIVLCTLERGSFSMKRIHRFDDFEATWSKMLARYYRGTATPKS